MDVAYPTEVVQQYFYIARYLILTLLPPDQFKVSAFLSATPVPVTVLE